MDPDLMADYAREGKGGKDTQFPDGMTIEVTITCGKARFKEVLGLFKWDGTKEDYSAEGFEGVDKFLVDAFMAVASKWIRIKAKLDTEEEVVLLEEEQAEPKKTYKAKTKIGDKEYSVTLKTLG